MTVTRPALSRQKSARRRSAAGKTAIVRVRASAPRARIKSRLTKRAQRASGRPNYALRCVLAASAATESASKAGVRSHGERARSLHFELRDQVGERGDVLERNRIVDGGAHATDQAMPLQAFHLQPLCLGQELGLEL